MKGDKRVVVDATHLEEHCPQCIYILLPNKQKWVQYPHLVINFPSGFTWSKLLPFHFNLLDYLIPECDLPLIQNSLWLCL